MAKKHTHETSVLWNELNIENQTYITNKGAGKKDGVYTARGILYRVTDGKVSHFACKGDIVQPFGAFNVVVGRYDWFNTRTDQLRKILANK